VLPFCVGKQLLFRETMMTVFIMMMTASIVMMTVWIMMMAVWIMMMTVFDYDDDSF
jgi:hypothetical protein